MEDTPLRAGADRDDQVSAGTDVAPERRRRHVLVQASVPPLDEDGRTAGIVGTLGFALATLVFVIRDSRHPRGTADWGLWICLAGLGIGLLFVAYCELRLWLRAQQAVEAEAATSGR